jgi:predicted amidohydrolase
MPVIAGQRRESILSAITVAAVQASPLPVAGLPAFGRDDTLTAFEADVMRVREGIQEGPALLVYPELHLFGSDEHPAAGREQVLRTAAQPLDSELVKRLGRIARASAVWLVPGSVCEAGNGGALFNTALVFAPDGGLAGTYRKVFPWRPYEPYTPGDRFVTVDLPGTCRLGMSICYDAWFPEVSRHLAWMGADIIVNLVKTTTSDRPHELVLARANSIVNQVFMVSVNCAGPVGRGQSIIVDPEGEVLQESPGDAPQVLYQRLDPDQVERVREHGTAGTNRMWSQFLPSDPDLEMPLYQGRIDPTAWSPSRLSTRSPLTSRQPLEQKGALHD